MAKSFLLGVCLALLGAYLWPVLGPAVLQSFRGSSLLHSLQGPVGPQGPEGPRGPVGEALKAVFGGVTNYDSLSLNQDLSVAGTSTQGVASSTGYRVVGGIQYADIQQNINNATSSAFCSIINPFGAATSSILMAYTSMFSSSTKDIAYDIATTTAAFRYGTTTPSLVYNRAVPARQLAKENFLWIPQLRASTSVTSYLLENNKVFLQGPNNQDGNMPFSLGPNESLNWVIATGTPGPIGYWSGSCGASFMRQ